MNFLLCVFFSRASENREAEKMNNFSEMISMTLMRGVAARREATVFAHQLFRPLKDESRRPFEITSADARITRWLHRLIESNRRRAPRRAANRAPRRWFRFALMSLQKFLESARSAAREMGDIARLGSIRRKFIVFARRGYIIINIIRGDLRIPLGAHSITERRNFVTQYI